MAERMKKGARPGSVRKPASGARGHRKKPGIQNEKAGRAKQRLRESALRFQALVDSGQALIWTSGKDKKCDYFNLPWLRFRGRTLEQELGDGWLEGVHPDDLGPCIERYQRAFERRERFSIEYRLRRHDGEFRWIQDDGTPRFGVRGNFLGYIGHCLDVTDRKRAEERSEALLAAVQKEKTNLSTLIDSIADEIWFADPEGRFTLANPAALREFALDPDRLVDVETLAKSLEVFRPDGSPRPFEEAPPLRALAGEVVRNQEELVRTSSGLRHRQVSAAPVRDVSGNIIGAVAVVRDITEIKNSEAARKQSEERFRELFDFMSSGVAVYEAVEGGADFLFKDFNPAAEKIEHVRREDVLGRRVTEVFPGVKALGIFAVFQRVWRTGTMEHFPAHLYKDERDPGSWRENWVFKLPTGEVVAVYNDITDRVRAEERLRESEEQLRAFMDNAPDGVYLNDLAGTFLYGNHRTEEITGYPGEELIGKSMLKLNLLSPDGLSKAARLLQENAKGRPTGPDELTLTKKDGGRVVVEINTSVVRRQGQPVVIGFVRDITERKQAAEKLRESERKYRELYDFLPISVYEMDLQANITAANRAIFKAFRATEEDFQKGFNAWKLLSPEDVKKSAENIERLVKGDVIEGTEYVFTRLDGSTFPAIVVSSVIFDHGRPVGLRGAVIDITERKQAEDTVQAALREKEILLREIHHRVKNNMQVISSLFNLQAAHITAENACRVLKEGQLRIRSMALVHEKLYQSRDLSKIDFADYLRSLAVHLFHFFRIEAGRIRLETKLEPVPLNINLAVPCGLLVNELVSNALKHGFPGDRKGTVEVGLRRREDGSVELRVADDGVGMSGPLDFRRSDSLGLQIVVLLVNQLDGTITLGKGKGTDFTITFQDPEQKPET